MHLTFEHIISILQLLTTIVGGAYAVFLFRRSNIEKRHSFILSIYDRLYNDVNISKVLYAADYQKGLEKLKDKLTHRKPGDVELENELDRALRYLDFIGSLLRQRMIRKTDLAPFEYAIGTILSEKTIVEYIDYQKEIKVNFDNLDYLRQLYGLL